LLGLPGVPKVVTIRTISGFIWKPGQNNIAMKLLLPANEVLGGLVSAAVAIPLAMGYGMFAFAPLGEDYFEDGAWRG
jgi:MFS superfamily sulfate permease-like transporter